MAKPLWVCLKANTGGERELGEGEVREESAQEESGRGQDGRERKRPEVSILVVKREKSRPVAQLLMEA